MKQHQRLRGGRTDFLTQLVLVCGVGGFHTLDAVVLGTSEETSGTKAVASVKTTTTKTTTTCGGLECQNNGRCAAGQDYDFPEALCDCSDATVRLGSRLQQFVGKTCQIEVSETDYCAFDALLFCVNEGACRVRGPNFDSTYCSCPKGFKGLYCEYQADEIQETCPLVCSNAGTCQHGIYPNSNDTGPNSVLGVGDDATRQFTFCECDSGFAGADCEFQYTTCEGDHFCFHGSTCRPLGSEQRCDCGSRSLPLSAGYYCEFLATDVCDNPVIIDSAAALGLFDPSNKIPVPEEHPFCVNDGDCFFVADTGDWYCLCNESRWSGPRCEVASIAPSPEPTPAPAGTSPAPTPQPSSMPTSKPSGPPRPSDLPTAAPSSSLLPSLSLVPTISGHPSSSIQPSSSPNDAPSSTPSSSTLPSISLQPTVSGRPTSSVGPSSKTTHNPSSMPSTAPSPRSHSPSLSPTSISAPPSANPSIRKPVTFLTPETNEVVSDPLVHFSFRLGWNYKDINKVVFHVESKTANGIWERLVTKKDFPIQPDGDYSVALDLANFGGHSDLGEKWKWRVVVLPKPSSGLARIKTRWQKFIFSVAVTPSTPSDSPSTNKPSRIPVPSPKPSKALVTFVFPQENDIVLAPEVKFAFELGWGWQDINLVVYHVEFKNNEGVWVRLITKKGLPIEQSGVYSDTQDLLETGIPSGPGKYKWRIMVLPKPSSGLQTIKSGWQVFSWE